MKSERWSEVESLYRAALEREPVQRRGFLTEACAGDADLLHEVESLLEYDHRAELFLEVPALQLEAQSISNERTRPMVDRQISHYRIFKKIGAGGMGEVWQARDTTLQRDVAIKLLPENFAFDPERSMRLEREAQVLASLDCVSYCTPVNEAC